MKQEKFKDLEELKAKCIQAGDKLTVLLADDCYKEVASCEVKDLKCAIECLNQTVSNVYSYLWKLEDKVYDIKYDAYEKLAEHKICHIPPINSPEKMQNALKSLGIDKDYEVYKPTVIVASDKKGNKTITLRIGK